MHHPLRALALIAACVLAGAASAQPSPGTTMLEGHQGDYGGQIRRTATSAFGPAVPPRTPEELQRANDQALRELLHNEATHIELDIRPGKDAWRVDIRLDGTPLGMTLPGAVSFDMANTAGPDWQPQPLPPPAADWSALVSYDAHALTLHLFARKNAAVVQLRLAPQAAGDDLGATMWCLDKEGTRATGWTGTLVRRGT